MKTEGIKYAGSKLKLLPFILELVRQVKPHTVLDGFTGSTRVAQALAKSGYVVIANDTAVWSEVFANCYLKNQQPVEHYLPFLKHLNHLPPVEGWFTEHYGGDVNNGSAVGKDGFKKPWQRHNTRKLDAIREEIDRLNLPPIEKCVLLTSLILAMDEVDSTLGHFASYLNTWSPRSYKTMTLKCPSLLPAHPENGVFCSDIFDLLPNIEVDLAYFDPPYGSNNEKMPPSRVRYAAYYHLWTTICRNDKPALFGKAKRRADSSDTKAASVFEEFRYNDEGRSVVVTAIGRMIREVKAKQIILSYSSGGRATAEELQQVINDSARLREIIEIDHKKNVMSRMRWTHEWTRSVEVKNKEFLFLIDK